ncbi:MAG TPA: DUF6797 domain-containing protein [Verrucomicrobiae bacterium]|nr:DUF6797 domain-containing protein [Verrucomicrobiae bacterium]
MKRILAALGCFLSFLLAARAAEPDPADRGPFFSGTIRARFPGDNVTMKGVVVTLNEEKNAFICYDTDLMRVSLAWTGDYLKLGNYMREISHPQPPEVAGAPVFGTKPGPGWAHGGSFADPRQNKQGPLPAPWAKYRGLYLHGRKVVLSYTVGSVNVLESPDAVTREGLTFVTRTLDLDKAEAMAFKVCDGLAAGAPAQLPALPAVLVMPESDGTNFIGVALGNSPEAALVLTNGSVEVRLSGKQSAAVQLSLAFWRGPQEDAAKFERIAPSVIGKRPPLATLTKGGPARWQEAVVTQGALATSGGDGPYVVDTISENLTNQWGTRAFFGGFDLFPDGRAAVCTFHGDVWIVSGLDATLEKLTWRRFATGIFQGLGLKVVDGKVHVLGRDQITRLHDLNGDGEADFYENFNNDTVVTANYHEFCLDLHTDSEGHFYYFKSSPWSPDVNSPHQGTLLKISKDGSRMEVFASGFRAPNGSAIGPRDEITVSDNEGHWMQASKLNLVKQGGFYGMMPAAQRELTLIRGGTNLTLNPSDPRARATLKVRAYDGDAPMPIHYDQPICWLPKNMDNSSGGQVWVTSDKWGPLKDHLLFMSYGRGTLFHVMQENIDGVAQAAMVKFPLKFSTGLMRGRINPKDGQVYLCGVRGWQTDGTKDGGFYRVRYTGKPVHTPVEFHALKNGLKLAFPNPLDSNSAADVANYAVEAWNYLYSGNYGSQEYSVADPTLKTHDKLEVKSARLSADCRAVSLEIPDLRPANQVKIKLNLKAADGTTISQDIYATIHKMGGASVAAN